MRIQDSAKFLNESGSYMVGREAVLPGFEAELIRNQLIVDECSRLANDTLFEDSRGALDLPGRGNAVTFDKHLPWLHIEMAMVQNKAKPILQRILEKDTPKGSVSKYSLQRSLIAYLISPNISSGTGLARYSSNV